MQAHAIAANISAKRPHFQATGTNTIKIVKPIQTVQSTNHSPLTVEMGADWSRLAATPKQSQQSTLGSGSSTKLKQLCE